MDYIIHVANVLYLASYSVRDILWLRILSVIAMLCLIPYFYLQPRPLWEPIVWQIFFIAVNVVRIYLLFLERRPVQLTPAEQKLFQMSFRSLKPREFRRLMQQAQWNEVPAGEKIINDNQTLETMMVIYSGNARVECQGNTVAELGPGQFMGELSFVTGEKSAADVITTEQSTIVSWPVDQLDSFLNKNPDMRTAIQYIIGADLATKLRPKRAVATALG